jgi:hypothetical protein
MTWLIWWIRSWFCKHNFLYTEAPYKKLDIWGNLLVSATKVSATCGKCGWHRSYLKFGK